jgi:hypothetical protein
MCRAAVLAGVVAGTPATLDAAGSLTVTVVNTQGARVPGARVCLGSSSNHIAFGTTSTDASGVARFTSVPGGTFLVTANLSGSGASRTLTGGDGAAAVTLRLAAGGPACVAGTVSIQPLPGQTGSTVVTPSPISPGLPAPQTLPTISPTPVTGDARFCFGALGADCGGAQVGLPLLALCSLGRCQINGGSWLHDECCVAHPHGMACQLGPLDAVTGNDGNCVAEWNRATSRLNYTWTRQVDFSKPNRTGIVVFTDYCAQSGSRVHVDDVPFCCTRSAHLLDVASSFADPNVRVCN